MQSVDYDIGISILHVDGSGATHTTPPHSAVPSIPATKSQAQDSTVTQTDTNSTTTEVEDVVEAKT